jgi:hypothetical protein
MSDDASSQPIEVLEHQGYQIRLSQTKLEWMAFVALPKQRPALIMVPDRQAVVNKAHSWIEAQLQSAKSSS